MMHQVSTTDIKAIVGYLEAYISKMKTEPRLLSTREVNQTRRATVLKRKLEKKLSLSE